VTTVGTHPPRVDLTVHAGEPVDVSIPVLDGSTGLAVSTLAGWTAAAQVRGTPDGPVLHTFAPTVEGTSVRVTASAAATAAWTFTTARWDVVLTDTAAVPHVLCAGWVRIYPTITR
jgi:hypothetical protein